ncbi:MAG: NAD(P)H-hydrate dehydratase [Oscillospiraceae bacterium]|jgi:NAD(P)H-hydrate epimerase|nr:NAD(P)H-hydrate dehydratase [Oscillospiraceae bacterium]
MSNAFAPSLPKREGDSHKGDYGKVLIVAGSVGLGGAALLCAKACVRSGAGLTALAAPQDLLTAAMVYCPEAMSFPQSLGAVLDKLEWASVCAFGPGLGMTSETRKLTAALIRESKIPLIIDADGINALAERIYLLDSAKSAIVLTPHEGEFRRLAPKYTGSREERAARFAGEHNCIVVLKGAGTVTAFPDGEIVVNSTGGPGMAKGGSGDALTGVIAALTAQFPPISAVPAAVYLHGLAGDLAAAEFGEYSMTPSDLIEKLPEAFKRITR